jgi:hypothetical protein
MAKKLDEQLVDRRIVDRNIKKGLIDRKEYDKYLDGLDDTSENMEYVSLEEEEETEGEGQGEGEETSADADDEKES